MKDRGEFVRDLETRDVSWYTLAGQLYDAESKLEHSIDADEFSLCDCCGSYATSTTDEDGAGNPLGHVQCAQCSRIAELEADRDQWKGRADQLSEERDTLSDGLDRAMAALKDDNAARDEQARQLTGLVNDVEQKVAYLTPAVELLTEENKALSSRLDACDLARSDDTKAYEKRLENAYARNRAVTTERDRLLGYFQWLRDCSDTEMRDGDAAREVARKALKNGVIGGHSSTVEHGASNADVAGSSPVDRSTLLAEIVAWFDVTAQKYEGNTIVTEWWPTDWLRRVKEPAVEKTLPIQESPK